MPCRSIFLTGNAFRVLNVQRSLKSTMVADVLEPPKIQRLPAPSIHPLCPSRPPGLLVTAPTPFVPYTPALPVVWSPLTQVHLPVEGVYAHRSFSAPDPDAPNPVPPK